MELEVDTYVAALARIGGSQFLAAVYNDASSRKVVAARNVSKAASDGTARLEGVASLRQSTDPRPLSGGSRKEAGEASWLPDQPCKEFRLHRDE